MIRKVMIVDDEPIMLGLLEIFMEDEGFSVTKATNGYEALTKMESELPDLIVLDIMMPKLDGWQTLKCLKKNVQTCHIPVIIISAMTEEEYRNRALAEGACEYIYKPFSPRDVVNRIQFFLH